MLAPPSPSSDQHVSLIDSISVLVGNENGPLDTIEESREANENAHSSGDNGGSDNPQSMVVGTASWRSHKRYILFAVFMAILTDMIVYGVVLPLLPAILKKVGGSGQTTVEMLSGVLLAVYGAGLVIATPVVGYFSDLYGNRKVPMLVGLVGLALATVFFALAVNFLLLTVARFFQGTV